MQLKDKFKFTVADKGDVVYTASKYMDYYEITWEWDGLRCNTAYSANIVESNIYSGRWKIMKMENTLPNEFKFKTKYGSLVFIAKLINGDYQVVQEGNERRFGEEDTAIHGVKFVHEYIDEGKWIVLPSQAKERSISININSAYAAAKWEFENNKLNWKPERSLQEVLDRINDSIEDIYEKAMNQDEFEYVFSSTGSWTVQFQPEDENYGTINVVTDVSTGMPIHYINVEEYLNKS